MSSTSVQPVPERSCRQAVLRSAKAMQLANTANATFGPAELASSLTNVRDREKCGELRDDDLLSLATDVQTLFPSSGQRRASSSLVFNGDEWLQLDLGVSADQVVAGSPDNPLIRVATKNIIEAPEKSFKTTATMRWALGASLGVTVFPQLPVSRSWKVLYLHGELSPGEIKERFAAATQNLDSSFNNFYQGRDLNAHLITEEGQNVIRGLVAKYGPQILIIDPWQSFIHGYDENTFEDVSKATHFLDEVIEHFNLTLFIDTHQGKDHSRGTRGHSSLAGWRDTRLVFSPVQNNTAIRVNVEPRWAKAPEPFLLKFRDGTVWPEGAAFTGQAAEIRDFVQANNRRVERARIGEHLGLKKDALRTALNRAQTAGAIKLDGDDVVLPELDGSGANGSTSQTPNK